ncbi:hypothetical protein [Pseudoalteromonas prydzensis]|uniref:hypothetical protein n=1 Tax=Pseudoalteromonas prydzensis TaxID=182141 RepID=UPI003FD584F5
MQTDYSNGAATALSYMADQGASKESIQLVAAVMDLNLDDIDTIDRERLVKAFGIEFFERKLKPYQVGENDIVLADNAESALMLLQGYTNLEAHDLDDVEDLSTQLDMKLSNEDGTFLSTLGDYIADMKEAQYIVGWE